MIGSTLGHYRVVEKIGAGGMGEVYRAEDLILGRRVAIKVLRADILAEEISRVRFLREARLIGGLNHPNIAVLYEAGESDGHPFLAMEFIEGTTLRAEISAGPMAEARVVQYAGELASALAHAHGRGVLHRDIKSANAIITPENKLKLLDFGLAKVIAAGDETRSVATEAGTWLGTVQYSAPEVLSGRAADVRSDIYSAGVVMYEMACGQLPFVGFDTASLINAILRGAAPAVQQRNPALSKAMVQVIARAMAVRADERFHSAEEMAEALRGIFAAASGAGSAVAGRAADGAAVLAVMEFENLSRDASVDWLGTGIAETIHADLKKLKSVRVIGRDRLQAALRSGAAATEVGAQLGARWLVRGGFQRMGEKLRITSTLVDVATGDAIAAGKVDGRWEDVFALQDRVVSELMNALEMNVDSGEMQRIAAPETLQLEAYEHYALGRKKFNELGKDSLEEAKRYFEKAIELDPQYAIAHSALGATYAMRFIHRTDPDDLVRSIAHSERALELDSELAEPYPFLSYAYMRQGKTEQAIQAGKKGVARQPDFGQAHYFLGAAQLIRGESHPESFADAARSFLDAGRVDPNWTPTWICLAEIAVLSGAYEDAERFARRDMEPPGPAKRALFPGAQLFLARIALRRGEPGAAREYYRRGMEEVAATNHMYRDSFLALGSCGEGDCDLRGGELEKALVHYRKAWNITKEFPRMLGRNRVAARALAGMAAAYSGSDRAHGLELAEEAAGMIAEISAQPQTWLWHASLSELWYGLAVARCRLGLVDAACEAMERAVAAGWGDAKWMDADGEMALARGEPRVRELSEKLRGRAAIAFE